MARSMTGFGVASVTQDHWTCTAEIRSVNQRFLDIRFRLPSGCAAFENGLKEVVRNTCQRGKIECTISVAQASTEDTQWSLNETMAADYASLLDQLEAKLKRPITLDLRALLSVDGLITESQDAPETEMLEQLLKTTVQQATEHLDQMRATEASALVTDMRQRLQTCHATLKTIEILAKDQPKAYFERLQANLKHLTGKQDFDEASVAREIALFSDRCDITEEITRFEAHLQQSDQLLKQEGSIGKKMDFLLQEFNREVNTIASKSHQSEISQHVITIKGELEKIREQIQNIE